MISRLRGLVIEKEHQLLIIDVQGIGYAVAVSDDRTYKLQDVVELQIYFHWNQEQGPQLFGFDSLFEKQVFAYIISCSGCGPRLGLSVLSQMAPAAFVQAVAVADTKALSSVSGIGPKKADLIIVHLKNKITTLVPQQGVPERAGLVKIKQLQQTLGALAYKPAEVTKALAFVHQEDFLQMPFDELLKKSLAYLSKR